MVEVSGLAIGRLVHLVDDLLGVDISRAFRHGVAALVAQRDLDSGVEIAVEAIGEHGVVVDARVGDDRLVVLTLQFHARGIISIISMARRGSWRDVVARLVAHHHVEVAIGILRGSDVTPRSALSGILCIGIAVLLIIERLAARRARLELVGVVASERRVSSHVHTYLLGIVVVGGISAVPLQVLADEVIVSRLREMVARVLALFSPVGVCLVGFLVVQPLKVELQVLGIHVGRHGEVDLAVDADGEVVGQILLLELRLSRRQRAGDVHLVYIRVESLKLHLKANVSEIVTLQSLDLQFDSVVVHLPQHELSRWVVGIGLGLLRHGVARLVE